jgi:hypothetical protein
VTCAATTEKFRKRESPQEGCALVISCFPGANYVQPGVKHKTATGHVNFQVSMAVTVQNEDNIKIGLKLIG